jgi:NAD(P)-dependent dehydrogenase (short-subunit alcohol dehydrogenase family)
VITELQGRSAVVTGAAGGIGLATAERLAEQGVRVLLADIDLAGLDEAVRRLRAGGAAAYGFPADVSQLASVEALAAEAEHRLGPVDILVNNAGVVTTGRAWELPLGEWRRVIDVDLWGVIHGVLAFLPRMLRAGTPSHVVNIGSMASVLPHPGLGPYVAAKHAVLGLSDSLRADLVSAGAPIGVTVVMPGQVRTAMNGEGASPRDVADAVVEAVLEDRTHVFTDRTRLADVTERFDAIVRQFTPDR